MARSSDEARTAPLAKVNPETPEVSHAEPPPSSRGSGAARVLGGSASLTHVRQEFRMSMGVMTDPTSLAEYEQAVPGCGKDILQRFFDRSRERSGTRRPR